MQKRILSASPRGFCAGVKNAVETLEEAVKAGKTYVLGEIVHNKTIAERFKSLGAVQIREVGEVPEGGTVVFSAHGVAPSVREAAKARNLKIIDATCPFVARIHEEAARLREAGYTIILIGDPKHDEVVGIAGEAPDVTVIVQNVNDIDALDVTGPVAWLSQTTLNADGTRAIAERLHAKFPHIKNPPSESCICNATLDRQTAVKNIAAECDLFVVVGSANSSNTLRLAEAARSARAARSAGAADVIRIDGADELAEVDFRGVTAVGVTSGVSVADSQFDSVVTYLKERLAEADV